LLKGHSSVLDRSCSNDGDGREKGDVELHCDRSVIEIV
jgi:hypothetical protein